MCATWFAAEGTLSDALALVCETVGVVRAREGKTRFDEREDGDIEARSSPGVYECVSKLSAGGFSLDVFEGGPPCGTD